MIAPKGIRLPKSPGETISNATARRYVKGGHNYVTASLDRILFDYLPRGRGSASSEREAREREDGWGEAKFTGSVCREAGHRGAEANTPKKRSGVSE